MAFIPTDLKINYINSLSEKTWEAFEAFHEVRGIRCPEKNEYDKTFSVPTKSDPQTLEAKMENGMLSITISKREKEKNRTITVK